MARSNPQPQNEDKAKQADQPQGDQPQGDQPQGDQPQGDQPQGEDKAKQADQPQGEPPPQGGSTDDPQGEQPPAQAAPEAAPKAAPEAATVRLNGNGNTAANVYGVSYKADAKGFFNVPENCVEHLLGHGFTRA